MALSLSALQEIVKRSSPEPWLFLIVISHPSMPSPLRFVQGSHTSVVSGGNTYLPTRFEVRLGGQEADGQARVKLVISVVDQTLLQTMQSLDPSPTIDLYAVMAASPSTIQFQQTGMQISYFDVVGSMAIEAELTTSSKLDETYPGILMDRVNVPGIFTDA